MNINERISKKFVGWNYEIISFTQSSKEFKIKCNNCGKIKIYKNFFHFINRKFACDCLSSASQCKSKIQIKELIEKVNKSQMFEIVEFTKEPTGKHKPCVIIKCRRCGKTFEQRTYKFLKMFKCKYCSEKSMPNTENRKIFLAERGYELLDEYINNTEKVLIRHLKCGFIWKTKIDRLNKFDGTCPKCNHKMSKGERKIRQFLIDNGFQYEMEHSFVWQSRGRMRYDFYIPKFNTIIEYNGRQHYEETNFFSNNLEENLKRDELKKVEALNNGYNYIIIPDTYYNNIEEILKKWFNDYPVNGVKGKLMVFERDSIQNKMDENIV